MVTTRAVLTVHHECPTCEAPPANAAASTAVLSPAAARTSSTAPARPWPATRPHAAWRARPGSLVPAARATGVHGRTAARARRYAVEIELYHWWQREDA